MNHKAGLLAIVTRNTYGEACTARDIGKVVRLRAHGYVYQPFDFLHRNPIKAWEVDDGPFTCPHCGQTRGGYAEADLLVIPPDDKVIEERVFVVKNGRVPRETVARIVRQTLRIDALPRNPNGGLL